MAYQISDIIETANARTDNRSKLNLKIELFNALGEFVNWKHWWWRKSVTTFQTAVGTSLYDLSASAIGLDEIIDVSSFDASGNFVNCLSPILDERAQMGSLVNVTSAAPAGYFIKPGTAQMLNLGAPADSVVSIAVSYWATIIPPDDESDETIPLIPPSLQWGLPTVLERRIFRQLLGENDPRVAVVEKDFKDFLAIADRKFSWSSRAQDFDNSGRRAVQAHD